MVWLQSNKKNIFLFLFSNILIYRFVDSNYLNPDGIGYFVYLPNIFHRQTLDFTAEYVSCRIFAPYAYSEAGFLVNIWQAGCSFFWAPFYWLCQLVVHLKSLPIEDPSSSFHLQTYDSLVRL